MITRVARFAARAADEDKNKAGLILGMPFKEGAHLIKPNHVYEIQEVMGVLQIVCVGECSASLTVHPKNVWAKDANTLIRDHRADIFCTAEENPITHFDEDL